MLEAAVSLLAGVVLGLSLAAPPGPMNAVIAEESVARGWRAGFAAGLGAMTADACFFVLALVGAVAVVQDHPGVRTAMFAVGGLLMVYYAYGAARGAGSFSDASADAAGDHVDAGDGRGFRKALALALANPYQVTWWLTAGVSLLNPGRISAFGVHLPAGNGALTVAGFFAGILAWISLFPASLRAAGDRVDAFGRVVAYASAAVLALFGASFLATAAGV